MKCRIQASHLLILAILILLISCNSSPRWEDYIGGIHFVVGVESRGDTNMDSNNVKIIADILDRRLKVFGIKKRIVKIIGNNQIAIQIPQVKNANLIVKIMSKSAILEFRLIDEKIKANEFKPNEKQSTRELLYRFETNPRTGEKIKIPYVTETENILRIGEYIKNTEVKNENGQDQNLIIIELKDKGAKLFEDFTANHINRRLAVVLNNEIYSTPIIQEKISGGRIQIKGDFNKEEASNLAIILRAGGYPAQTKLIESKELTKDCWLGST